MNERLRISEVPAGLGTIGITLAPGKRGVSHYGGVHRRDLNADLDVIAAWGATAVVTLIEDREMREWEIESLPDEVRLRHMEWHHLPIVDVSVPDEKFDAEWSSHSYELRGLLQRGNRILVHCRGGIGRAGMIAARLLVEFGCGPAEALATVRGARHPNAVETELQELWVAAGRTANDATPSGESAAVRDRAIGAMLGLAVGDAVGAALEFSPKPTFAVLDDMVGGGPHRLKPGEWTDDTAMALALADSLIFDPTLNARDLMDRFVDWRWNGTYSCTGHCFDIGITTSGALNRYRRHGNPLAGAEHPSQSGNGALMRLSPVAVRHWQNHPALDSVAALQTLTTHGSPDTLHASKIFVRLVASAIQGRSLTDLLAGPIAQEVNGGFRGRHRDEIEGSGYVAKSLQAAIWAVNRTTSFRSAVLLAANLGDDADTTAAVAGQFAGAIYGRSGIPAGWLEKLAWRERLEQTAASLYERSLAIS